MHKAGVLHRIPFVIKPFEDGPLVICETIAEIASIPLTRARFAKFQSRSSMKSRDDENARSRIARRKARVIAWRDANAKRLPEKGTRL